MNVFVYSYRDFDEAEYFTRYAKAYGIQLRVCREAPTPENAGLVSGCPAVSVITSKINRPLLQAFAAQGVKVVSTRTIGYDHIDLQAAKETGIQVCNGGYPPDSVAEYTLFLTLFCLRRAKQMMQRAAINNFSLNGVQGQLLHGKTIGVFGTGRIGSRVAELFAGCGCRVYVCDKHQNEKIKPFAAYADADTLFTNCDILTLHMPMTPDTHHFIDAQALAKMKPGVILINTARGKLIDTPALADALEAGKVGAAGLDVIEQEMGLYYYDRQNDLLRNRWLSVLRGYPNVVVTPHMAFYTDNAIEHMVKSTLEGCLLAEKGEDNPWKIV